MKRRTFIRSAAFFTAGLLADQIAEHFVINPAIETAEALTAPQPRDPFVATNFRRMFEQHAAPRQRRAFDLWSAGALTVAALPVIDPDKIHAVIAFDGPRARYEVFGAGLTVLPPQTAAGRPIIGDPDPAYGRFVYDRAAAVYMSGKWTFESCFGHSAGRAEPVRYLSLMLPLGNRVVSVGSPAREWQSSARHESAPQDAAPSHLRSGATT